MQEVHVPLDTNKPPCIVKKTVSTLNDEKIIFVDPAPDKPFDYSVPAITEAEKQKYELANQTVIYSLKKSLSKVINKPHLPKSEFKEHKECFNCIHPKHHIDKVGVMEIAALGTTFYVALDARDQTNSGRGYVTFANHISALRHVPDEWITILQNISECYQSACERQFNLNKTSTIFSSSRIDKFK